MPASYWDREASYRKRIGIIVPVAIGLILASFLLSGRFEYQEMSRFVGWRGPIELLPEITVEPETALPPAPLPAPTPKTQEPAALDVADEAALEPGTPDLESNPPRPNAAASARVDRPEPEAAPAREEVSYSESYVILHMVKPTYPKRELADGIEGNVTVELVVDERGDVVEANVVSSIGPVSFQESTLEAVRTFRFQPATENGKPVSMRIKFLVKFRIMA